ncbi:MAG: hypothetical protein ACRCYC_00945 [Paraclostridium sp.]|uniref:hypothetical protein n=1 Tax=Paraclostridium sp. TaxID=2023273 RepID=UPI003F2FD961
MEIKIMFRFIVGVLGATPFMFLISELLRVRGVFTNTIIWIICFFISAFCLGELGGALMVLFLVINIFIITGYLSIYCPKAIKYLKK